MTQRERILDALQRGPVCGTDFLRWLIPRYAARIHELRVSGEIIETTPCKLHDHKGQVMYVLHRQSQHDIDWCICGSSLGAITHVSEVGIRVEHKGVWV